MRNRTNRTDDTRNDRGAVLVEYAFAFPVLLLVVVAGLSLLWLSAMKATVGQAAREGARYASTALPPTYRTHPDAAAVAARIDRKVPLVHLTAANVTIVYAGCPNPCTSPAANTPVTVTVAIDVPSPLRPFASIFGAGQTIKTSSHGEVRAE
jgi:Flp pilus assembly protein TadG